MRWITALLLATVLCTAAAAQSANLTYAPPVGDAIAYKATIEGALDVPNMPGLQVTCQAQYRWAVTAAVEDRATRQVTVDSASLDISGQKLPCTLVGFPAEGVYGPDGRLVEATKPFPEPPQDSADELVVMLVELHALWLPAKEVAVGDTWEIDAENPPSLIDTGATERSEKLHLKGTLESLEGSVATIVTEYSIEGEETGGTGKGELKCTLKVDTATWAVISGEAVVNVTNEVQGAQIVLRDWRVKIERVAE